MAKLRVDKIAAPIVKDEFTGSVYFDGTGDYLSISDSTDFDLGISNEPFTMELWFYKTAAAGTHCELGVLRGGGAAAWNGSDGHQYRGFQYTDNKLYWQWWNGSANKSIVSSATPAINTWHHFAVSYDGATTRAFLNGVIFGTSTEAYAKPSASNITRIGQDPSNSVTAHGYHSNVRVCKGHAVYTSNFTPPTRELEVHLGAKGVVFPAADNRTVLLSCQSSTDATADATGRHIITANGNVTAADANPGLFRKTNITSTITENTGSVFFDGVNDYLSIADSDDFSFGSGDFTIEGFIYPTGIPQGSYATLVTPGLSLQIYFMSSNSLSLYVSSNGSSYNMISTANATGTDSIFQNEWSHFALTRSGNTFRYFINGIEKYTNTVAGAIYNDLTPLGIGDYTTALGTYEFQGYMSNIRICKGHAVYTENFTVPTRELEVHPETVLLACYDGENIFADKSGRHIIAAYGDRTSSPTPTATDSPIGITTHNPGLTRNVDPTDGPTFQGGVGFTSQNWLTLPKGTTTERGRGRGLFGGGLAPSRTNSIDYIQIQTQGNALDFGDLASIREKLAGAAGAIKGLFAGGDISPTTNAIEFVTISTTGNATDFGDLTDSRDDIAGAANHTRAAFFGGDSTNIIDFVTIASLGNAQDFGDLTGTGNSGCGCGSPTRGIIFIGTTVQYITWATTGNAQDFGDTTITNTSRMALSDSTRGIVAGGYASPAISNVIEYVTIATLGNAQDFGDMVDGIYEPCGASSNSIRGVLAGGETSVIVNTITYVTIQSTGNAKDFGDLTQRRKIGAACSDSHGGIS